MPETEKKFQHLLKTIKQYNPKADLGLIELAFEFAKEAHQGQKRMTGEDYIIHPLATAQNLAELKLSTQLLLPDYFMMCLKIQEIPLKISRKILAKKFPF